MLLALENPVQSYHFVGKNMLGTIFLVSDINMAYTYNSLFAVTGWTQICYYENVVVRNS
jgi:hypothetical protein